MHIISSEQYSLHDLSVEELTTELINFRSVTPVDAGCQDFIISYLEELGFTCYSFIDNGVTNLFATIKFSDSGVHGAFVGHTDVVPAAKPELWKYPPFDGKIVDGKLYGRGSSDMKGGIAAILCALTRFVREKIAKKGSFSVILTSDEEGEAEHGCKSIARYLKDESIELDFCLVGEPTSELFTGDTIKIGRRGAISCEIDVAGKSGHVAYPQHTINAANIASTICYELNQISWKKTGHTLTGTNLEVSGLKTGTFTDNIVPGSCALSFNVRFDFPYTLNLVQEEINSILTKYEDHINHDWQRYCAPYFTVPNDKRTYSMQNALCAAIYSTTSVFPKVSSDGGTSDGRFFASENTQVIEIGVPNSSIHQINEFVTVQDLKSLELIYHAFLTNTFVNKSKKCFLAGI